VKNPFKVDDEEGGGGTVITFLLIAAGIAVVLWLLFGRGPQPAQREQITQEASGRVTMTCTCRPAGGEQR